MSTAIIHEWIDSAAGSEQVFAEIAEMFPDADLFALSSRPGVNLGLGQRPIHTTFLNHIALRDRRQLTLPIMPLAWRALGKQKYDTVITSHHAFAHSNRLAQRRHLCYVHSPARYVWSPDVDSRGSGPMKKLASSFLKPIDRRFCQKVDHYAANSTEVADRIRRFWDRDAQVIFPPVRLDAFGSNISDYMPTRDYILGFGRWVPYKNLTRVIEIGEASNIPVVIAGRGPDGARIRAAADRARVDVTVIQSPSDGELRNLYRNAKCLVFPTVEDFGIVPVEAQAAGTPVVALGAGGARDTVVPGVSGYLVTVDDLDAWTDAIARVPMIQASGCIASAQRFSPENFRRQFASWCK